MLAVCVFPSVSFAILSGCASLQKQYAPSERPSFFAPEIHSRTWVDPDGAGLSFLDSIVTNLGSHGEFMIARFGNTNANQARCLEFYKIHRKPDNTLQDKYLLIDHDWGPREQSWWPSIVISVEPIVRNDGVSFQISRESISKRGGVEKRLLYFLDYRAGAGVTPNMSEWWIQRP